MHAISGGIPRVINTLATTALLDAFGDDAATIDAARISAAAREHRLRAAGVAGRESGVGDKASSQDERIESSHG